MMVRTSFTLLIPAFALLFAPPVLTVWLLCFRTLPYHCSSKDKQFTASVGCLSLGTFSVPAHSTSTARGLPFTLSIYLETLAGDLGCFPFDDEA